MEVGMADLAALFYLMAKIILLIEHRTLSENNYGIAVY